MADDWRVTITLPEEEHTGRILEALREREVRDELRDALGGRVAVSSDGPNLFLYADNRRAAEAGISALREVLDEQGLVTEPRLDRWHPLAEQWEDASVPLPETEEQRAAERERLEEAEEQESLSTGIAQWEVRVELPTANAAEQEARRLEDDGYSVVRRSTYLLVGANDRDEAEELAERLGQVGTVQVEPGSGVAYQLMPRNPFAVFFGGLAG